jgi:hypothetical protein
LHFQSCCSSHHVGVTASRRDLNGWKQNPGLPRAPHTHTRARANTYNEKEYYVEAREEEEEDDDDDDEEEESREEAVASSRAEHPT